MNKTNTLALFISVVLAAFAAPLSAQRTDNAPPMAMQADAYIECRSPYLGEASPLPDTFALFGIYTVTKDEILFEVDWAEPHWQGINFTVYPVTFFISIDRESLKAGNLLRDESWTFAKKGSPFVPPINQVEQRHFENLLRFEERFHDLKNAFERAIGKNFTAAPDASPFTVLLATSETGAMTAQWTDDGKRMVHAINYQYENSGDAYPSSLNVIMPERLAPSGTKAQGSKMVNNQVIPYSEEIMHTLFKGGRNVSVDYQNVNLNGMEMRVPHNIKVHNTQTQETLRLARLTDYRMIRANSPIRDSQLGDSRYGEVELEWRELLIRYWMTHPTHIPPPDKTRLQEVKGRLEERLSSSERIRHRLKYTHMLHLTGCMLGDEEMKQTYAQLHFDLLGTVASEGMMKASREALDAMLERWRKEGVE